MIDSLEGLAEHIGANEPTEPSLSRRVYKDTACGAWLEVAHNPDGTLWGVRVGSIIEGSEAVVEPVELAMPFSPERWDEAIQQVEAEAECLWNEAHPDGVP